MTTQSPNYVAAGNISPFRFVKTYTSADNAVVQADANARIVGVAQEAGRSAPIPDVSTNYAAVSGDPIHVYGLGEQPLLELGGTVAAGDLLKADSSGKGVVIATTGTTIQNVGARALSAGASGEKIRVQVINDSIRPALS